MAPPVNGPPFGNKESWPPKGFFVEEFHVLAYFVAAKCCQLDIQEYFFGPEGEAVPALCQNAPLGIQGGDTPVHVGIMGRQGALGCEGHHSMQWTSQGRFSCGEVVQPPSGEIRSGIIRRCRECHGRFGHAGTCSGGRSGPGGRPSKRWHGEKPVA